MVCTWWSEDSSVGLCSLLPPLFGFQGSNSVCQASPASILTWCFLSFYILTCRCKLLGGRRTQPWWAFLPRSHGCGESKLPSQEYLTGHCLHHELAACGITREAVFWVESVGTMYTDLDFCLFFLGVPLAYLSSWLFMYSQIVRSSIPERISVNRHKPIMFMNCLRQISR